MSGANAESLSPDTLRLNMSVDGLNKSGEAAAGQKTGRGYPHMKHVMCSTCIVTVTQQILVRVRACVRACQSGVPVNECVHASESG